MQIKKRTVCWLVLAMVITACFYSWFGAKEPPPPERSFSTSQLLIPPLTGWGSYSGPEDRPARDFYLARAVGGSVVRFMKPPDGIEQWSPDDVNYGLWEPVADMEQWVIKFYTVGDARRAYREHYWIVDSPTPLDGLEYRSWTADSFRIVCKPDQRIVTSCYIEGRYDEFYVLVRYSSVNAGNNDDLISDLSAIAAAVDAQMEKFLGSQK